MLIFSNLYGFDKEWDIEAPVISKNSDDYTEFTQMLTDNIGYPEMPELQLPSLSDLFNVDETTVPQELLDNPPYEGFPNAPEFPMESLEHFIDVIEHFMSSFENYFHIFDFG